MGSYTTKERFSHRKILSSNLITSKQLENFFKLTLFTFFSYSSAHCKQQISILCFMLFVALSNHDNRLPGIEALSLYVTLHFGKQMVNLSDCHFLWITGDVSLAWRPFKERICHLQVIPLLWVCDNGITKYDFFSFWYWKSKNMWSK